MVYENETVQGGTMTWKIIDDKEVDLEDIDTIDKFISSFVGKIHNNEIIELGMAWDRVQELAQKGMVAEKYTKEWDNEKRTK